MYVPVEEKQDPRGQALESRHRGEAALQFIDSRSGLAAFPGTYLADGALRRSASIAEARWCTGGRQSFRRAKPWHAKRKERSAWNKLGRRAGRLLKREKSQRLNADRLVHG